MTKKVAYTGNARVAINYKNKHRAEEQNPAWNMNTYEYK